MDALRRIVLITGLIFLIIGFYRLLFPNEKDSYYTSAILILIGGALVLAIRRK